MKTAIGFKIAPRHKEFMNHFGTKDIFRLDILSAQTKQYQFDIIKFDDWLHDFHNYKEEKHGSIKDFIFLKFEKEAMTFIESLFN
jgi:hypothetical protein